MYPGCTGLHPFHCWLLLIVEVNDAHSPLVSFGRVSNVAQTASFLPSPVSLLDTLSYVAESSTLVRNEGIRRVLPWCMTSLLITVSLADSDKRRIFPVWDIPGLGLIIGHSCFILGRK